MQTFVSTSANLDNIFPCPHCRSRDDRPKASFVSEEQAEAEITSRAKRHPNRDGRVYACPHGHGFHIAERRRAR